MTLGHERASNPGDEGLTDTRGQAASQVKRDRAFSSSKSMANSPGFSAARNASPKNAAFISGQPASKGEAAPTTCRGGRGHPTAGLPHIRPGPDVRVAALRRDLGRIQTRHDQGRRRRRVVACGGQAAPAAGVHAPHRSGRSASGDRLLTAGQDTARPRVPEAQGLIRQQGSRQHARTRSGRPLGTCPGLHGSELPRVRISCQPHDAQPGRLAFRSREGEAPSLAAGHGGPAGSPTSDLQWSATRWSLAGEGSGEAPMATYAAGQRATRGRRPTVSAGVPIVASKITAPGWSGNSIYYIVT